MSIVTSARIEEQRERKAQRIADMEPEITIDPEFEKLIPPLSAQEFALLREQILDKGCLEPLIVWKTEEDQRILLDGHNRYRICTEIGVRPEFRKVPNITTREQAKIWILMHQAGRRNLTDDQRAVIWNDIREARSKLAVADKMANAREAKDAGPMSAKTTDIVAPKKDTRKEIAQEAKVPESKLRQVQALKNADPKAYEQVRTGESSLRAARKKLRIRRPGAKSRKDRDYFCRIGRKLDGVFKGELRAKLEDVARLRREELTPVTKKGLQQVVEILGEVSDLADKYASRLVVVLHQDDKAA